MVLGSCCWRRSCRLSRQLALASRPGRDGGNLEGLSLQFIDDQPQQAYCANASLYALPDTQPIDRPEPVISLQVRGERLPACMGRAATRELQSATPYMALLGGGRCTATSATSPAPPPLAPPARTRPAGRQVLPHLPARLVGLP